MPALRSLLAALLPARLVGPAAGAAVQAAWLLPAYATCLVLNLVWCKEIAELTARAAQRRAQQREADRKRVALPPPGGRPGQPPLLQRVCRPGAVELASQEAYKALLLAVVLLQVPAVGRLPVAGAEGELADVQGGRAGGRAGGREERLGAPASGDEGADAVRSLARCAQGPR
jgi:hypothetical protein